MLKEHAASHLDYDGIKVCTHDAIRQGAGLAIENGVECVIGLGGAACVDTAKAITFCARHADDMDAYLTYELEQRNDEKLPLVLIPTYPSTGSKATEAPQTMSSSATPTGACSAFLNAAAFRRRSTRTGLHPRGRPWPMQPTR